MLSAMQINLSVPDKKMRLLTVVKADELQLSAIARIGRESFAHAFSKLFNSPGELLHYLDNTYTIEKLRASMRNENNLYFLALMDHQPVGFSKIKKYSLNDHIESIAQMELQKIYVLPGEQGSGAGSVLMNAVFQQAIKLRLDYVWLDVHVSNSRAIQFYEKKGFVKYAKKYFVIGTQTFEYHVMVLGLKDSQLLMNRSRILNGNK